MVVETLHAVSQAGCGARQLLAVYNPVFSLITEIIRKITATKAANYFCLRQDPHEGVRKGGEITGNYHDFRTFDLLRVIPLHIANRTCCFREPLFCPCNPLPLLLPKPQLHVKICTVGRCENATADLPTPSRGVSLRPFRRTCCIAALRPELSFKIHDGALMS